MGHLVKKWIPILIALVVGWVVLAGYLIPTSRTLVYFRDRLVEWAIIVAAFAFLLGLLNILSVHGGRVIRLRRGWLHSLVLLLAAAIAWVPPFLPRDNPIRGTLDRIAFDFVISPSGAALAALLVFTLTLAAFRLLRARRSAEVVFFLFIVAVALLGSTPLINLGWLANIRDWIINVPGMAGMRGLLLGVALGTVITALRVLIASERPYSEF